MTLQIFIQKYELNDATSYYVNLLKSGLSNLFDKIVEVNNVNDIDKSSYTLVISIIQYLKLVKRRKHHNVIFWAQGIAPEEISYFTIKKGLRYHIRVKYYEFLERSVLKHSRLTFLVSNAMKEHYERKYHISLSNYCIIPCFNKQIDANAFNYPNKYAKNSFVYAGAIYGWQCLPETIELFKSIQNYLPDCSLSILTKDTEAASKIVKNSGAKNVAIKYVPIEQLNDELSKYKFGFLIREDNAVNNVATPTKFNTYLALGLIPIITDVIHDFSYYINKMKYIISLKPNQDYDAQAKKIVQFCKNKISQTDILKEYTGICDEYYNRNKYLSMISKINLQMTDKR